MLYDIPLEQINLAHLEALRQNRVIEDLRIDYKADIPPLHKIKEDFPQDVIAFANSFGGDIVYGITDADGFPAAICGVKTKDIDNARKTMEDLLANNVKPRLIGVRIHPIKIAEDSFCIVVRVPRSWNAPHAVMDGRKFNFYARRSGVNAAMDYTELRGAFAASESLAARVQALRESVVSRLVDGGEPIYTGTGSKILIQLIPLTAFDPNSNADFSKIKTVPGEFQLISKWKVNARYNLEGFFGYARGRGSMPPADYIQFYRNGCVEAVDVTRLVGVTPNFYGPELAHQLINDIRNIVTVMAGMEVFPPMTVMVTFLNVQGGKITGGSPAWDHSDGIGFDRAVIRCPAILIDNPDSTIERQLRPMLDALWNASGWDRCWVYGDTGELQSKDSFQRFY